MLHPCTISSTYLLAYVHVLVGKFLSAELTLIFAKGL